MSDSQTTIRQLRDLVAKFVSERDWNQFHSPKNLSMSISIEAAELMEHFQWISQTDSANLGEEKQTEVREELADVMCYCLALANSMNIDIASSIEMKMDRNREKYPAEQFKGYYGHDDPALGGTD